MLFCLSGIPVLRAKQVGISGLLKLLKLDVAKVQEISLVIKLLGHAEGPNDSPVVLRTALTRTFILRR